VLFFLLPSSIPSMSAQMCEFSNLACVNLVGTDTFSFPRKLAAVFMLGLTLFIFAAPQISDHTLNQVGRNSATGIVRGMLLGAVRHSPFSSMSFLAADNSLGDLLTFGGRNFAMRPVGATTVHYGPDDWPLRYLCTISQVLSALRLT
jgi:hypothetical protein